jgi:hypothetical protein
MREMALGRLKSLVFVRQTPAGPMAAMPKIPNTTNHMRPTVVGAFILPSPAGALDFALPLRQMCDDSRQPSTKRDFDHCG